MDHKLGEQMKVVVISMRGNVSEESGMDLVYEIVSKMGMNEAPGKSISRYPVNGKGGVGYTFFQPITESFIALDAWPDLGGAYLVICSCLEFPVAPIIDIIVDRGFEIKDCKYQKAAI